MDTVTVQWDIFGQHTIGDTIIVRCSDGDINYYLLLDKTTRRPYHGPVYNTLDYVLELAQGYVSDYHPAAWFGDNFILLTNSQDIESTLLDIGQDKLIGQVNSLFVSLDPDGCEYTTVWGSPKAVPHNYTIYAYIGKSI